MISRGVVASDEFFLIHPGWDPRGFERPCQRPDTEVRTSPVDGREQPLDDVGARRVLGQNRGAAEITVGSSFNR